MRSRFVPLLFAAAICVAPAVGHAQSSIQGERLFKAYDYAKARVQLTGAVQKNADDPRAHYYLGRLAILDNDADAAAEHFEKAVKIDDANAEYHLWYGNAIRVQAGRASGMAQAMLAPKMKEQYERAMALDPKNLDARDALVDFYSVAPDFMGGGPEKAAEQAKAIAALDASRGHLVYGRLAIRARDTATVEREYNAAIAAAPDSIRAYTALSNYYSSAKKWPEAFAVMERYIKRHPDDVRGPYGIGRIAGLSGQQLPRGEQGIRAYLAKPPRELGAASISIGYYRLGQVLAQEGKTADARAAFEQAVKLDGRNEDAKKALAEAK